MRPPPLQGACTWPLQLDLPSLDRLLSSESYSRSRCNRTTEMQHLTADPCLREHLDSQLRGLLLLARPP